MKIAIIGATGHAGSFILDEALSRDLDVTAIVRHPEKLPSDVPFIQKDLFELTTTDLASFDVVVDAFNAPKGKEEMHQTSLSHLIEMLEGTDTRLIVVGGASSLFLDTEKTTRMIDQVPKNAPFYPTAFNMYEGLLKLKQSKNLHWTYLLLFIFLLIELFKSKIAQLLHLDLYHRFQNHVQRQNLFLSKHFPSLNEQVLSYCFPC